MYGKHENTINVFIFSPKFTPNIQLYLRHVALKMSEKMIGQQQVDCSKADWHAMSAFLVACSLLCGASQASVLDS